jgi:hypothetical protein
MREGGRETRLRKCKNADHKQSRPRRTQRNSCDRVPSVREAGVVSNFEA